MTTLKSESTNRIGFHYFADTAHYTNKDLNTYLPYLEKMGAGWLVLLSETSRAIPETFITGLVSKRISPIIHFPLRLPDAPAAADLKAILNAYSKWGAKYVILFDRPNDRSSWSASGWSQSNLVENFLDRYIPLANECLKAGLSPVFPALEPGGSYWDLSFLRTALLALQRRGQKNLLTNLTLACYGYTFGHLLNWGLGGPERWSGNKPYITPADSQDQKGFRNFEWVDAVVKSTLGKSLPMILLGLSQKTGKIGDLFTDEQRMDVVKGILATLRSNPENDQSIQNILAGNFWLLAASNKEEFYGQAWIKEDGSTLPLTNLFTSEFKTAPLEQKTVTRNLTYQKSNSNEKQISHYLLLPLYEWGVADWHLEVIKPYILKYHPTVGFSLKEAALAQKVTVIGGEKTFTEDQLNDLRNHGSEVERISGDGTTIATQLSER